MLRHIAIAASLTVVLLVDVVAPAFADSGGGGNQSGWGSVECDQNPSPGCQLGAGSGGAPPGAGAGTPGPGGPSSNNSGGDGGGASAPDPNPNPVQCSYVRSDFQPPPDSGGMVPAVASEQPLNAVAASGSPPQPGGAWYVYQCTGNGQRDAVYRAPIWMPTANPAGPPAPSPAELAAQARDQLRLPGPSIQLSPAGAQLVSLPSWLWLSTGSWGARSATAAVPGASVTASATPVSVSWSMGDGDTVTCTGPGTPYSAGVNPDSASPDCGYTYRQSSISQPGQVFTVTATVHWTVSWSGAGQAGAFPDLTTTATARVPVGESQALNTH